MDRPGASSGGRRPWHSGGHIMNGSHTVGPAVALVGLLAISQPGLGQTPELSYDPSAPVYLLTYSDVVRKELKVQDEQVTKVRELAKSGGLTDAKSREKLSQI